MNNQEVLIDKFEEVSFYESARKQQSERQKPNFFERVFQDSSLLYYYLALGLLEYLLLYQLSFCFREAEQVNVRVFLFYLSRTLSGVLLFDQTVNSPLELRQELQNFKMNMMKDHGFQFMFCTNIAIQLIFLETITSFRIVDIQLMFFNKFVFQLLIQITKGLPLKNQYYKFLIIQGVFLLL